MPSPFYIFSRSNTTKQTPIPFPFKDYYTNWFNTLKNTLLPLLHHSLSYSPLLSPPPHPPTPPLLLRNSDEDTENDRKVLVFDRPCHVVMAWKDPSKHLMIKIEQIERGLRLMVPALLDRVKKAQSGFAGKIAEEWVSCERKEKMDVSEAMKAEMEESVTVFLHANRLRRSVISDIVAALNVYQGALFLEGLAQFLVGFQGQEFAPCASIERLCLFGTPWALPRSLSTSCNSLRGVSMTFMLDSISSE
ncbi:hypothetical protein POTOM_000982 [Populus tomentosa]|uniref:DOG1 domain-containing protein n=1 Tax=Populus tomentosa TaxID=118781 RepID=A0A8X8DH34_POPTO|nr:hypothetical protein POTOM_000982 [Populus tomentosa]